MANIIDGKGLASELRRRIAEDVKVLKADGTAPGLAVIFVGGNSASSVYVRNKRSACSEVGIESFSHEFPAEVGQDKLIQLIEKLNGDPKVHGILVQLPLPAHIDENLVIERISPEKDVDGFSAVNAGKLVRGEKSLRPCTPLGIMKLIDSAGIDCAGKRAVIIGRSKIVGKPAALMLLERNATVTICHSRTADLPSEISRADIVVAAIGKPKFVKGEWIKKGAVVIDVGINRARHGKIVGDVDFESAAKNASAITPVPGGVGPMTIAMLLMNTVDAARKRNA